MGQGLNYFSSLSLFLTWLSQSLFMWATKVNNMNVSLKSDCPKNILHHSDKEESLLPLDVVRKHVLFLFKHNLTLNFTTQINVQSLTGNRPRRSSLSPVVKSAPEFDSQQLYQMGKCPFNPNPTGLVWKHHYFINYEWLIVHVCVCVDFVLWCHIVKYTWSLCDTAACYSFNWRNEIHIIQ